MPHSSPRLVIVIFVAVALAGCGAAAATGPSTTDGSTTTAIAPGSPSSPTTVSTSPPIPTGAASYAQAGYTAWSRGDTDALAMLTTLDAFTTLNENPWQEGWAFDHCEGTAGSTYCTWNLAGDQLVLQVGNETASSAQAHAIIGATLTTG